MSYTRRTGGTAGRPPTTQVNYHQQQTRSPSSNQQNRNANSGFTQQPVTYNSAAQPAFTTTPPMPSTQSKPAAPAQQAPPPQAAAPPTQAVAPTTAPATPAVKQEPVTPASTPKTPMETSENGEGGGTKVPFWKRRPVVKLSNKVRRARQNAKLRRILNPKNALTFLNELRPGTGKFVVREEPGWGYAATVEVDGKAFTGYGMSASRAKVQASEKALKFILLEQLSKSQQAAAETKEEPKDEEEAMDTTEQEGEEPKAKKQKVMAEDEVPWGSLAAFALHKLFSEWQKEGPVEAPLAQPYPIEKFDEDIGASGDDQFYTRRPLGPPDFGYRGRGFPPYPSRGRGFAPYPSPRGPPPPGFGPAPGRRPPVPPSPAAAQLAQWTSTGPPKPQGAPIGAAPMKKIPEDANQRHPVMLLNQLRPNVVYNETREGEQPRVTFIITIDVDGKQYVGRGRNKKEAKKMAAKAALAPMGIVYSDEV